MGFTASSSRAQSLRGSSRSLTIQNQQALAHDFTYLATPSQVQRFVELGYLVPLRGNRNYRVHQVSFPYARPEVRTFVERLASQYRRACGETLVVTSLTRPLSDQPRNASDRSVHPTGMALDLRRSNVRACRSWLENVLISLEANGVLEATRESRPPHFHIALFPSPYARYVDGLVTQVAQGDEAPAAETPSPLPTVPESQVAAATVEPEGGQYRVQRGDALWDIARAHRTTVAAIRQSNNLRGNRIYPGQMLAIAGEAGVQPAGGGSYRVRSGDALWDIARAHGTTVAAIQGSNNLRNSRIYPGQLLTIPSGGAVGVQYAVSSSYRVRRGDALWDIARAHGTTVAAIRRSNNLSGSRIYPGQVLTIPAQSR